ncbi:hypothetical protein J3459_010116 [Metarhizium acridum]|nr:hypothetical protein J3459_010116 [Metarhizium acridum]
MEAGAVLPPHHHGSPAPNSLTNCLTNPLTNPLTSNPLTKMGSEVPPTSQRGFGPTRAEGQSGPLPADIFNSLLATAGRASPLTQFFFFMYQMLGLRLGPDLSVILTFLGVFWVIIKMGSQAYTLVDGFIENHLMHSVVVPREDEIYTHVMKWLSKQERVVKGSCLVVQTVKNSDRDDDDNDDDEDLENAVDFTSGDDEDSSQRHLNFSKLVSKVVGLQLSLCHHV